MKAILLFIGSVIIWSGIAQAQDEVHGPFEFWGPGTSVNPITGEVDQTLISQWPSHRVCEQNFYSCGLNNFQVYYEQGTLKAEIATLRQTIDNIYLSTPRLDPTCVPIKRGELWKPVSETHGTPALLLSNEHADEKELFISDGNGDPVDTVLRTSCCPNGNRMHWYMRKACGTYPAFTYVRLEGGTCRVIENPCQRYE